MSQRVLQLAAERAERTAMVIVSPEGSERFLSWSALGRGIEAAARDLVRLGARAGDLVVVALPRCEEHFFACIGAWHIGARPLTLNPDMPGAERARLLELAEPSLLIARTDWLEATTVPGQAVTPGGGWPNPPREEAREELPPTPPSATFAIATGGSSGAPKVILSPYPGSFTDAHPVPAQPVNGMARDMVQLVNGPLYHNSPFTIAHSGLTWGHTLVLMERFEAGLALRLIERHAVSYLPTVPTVMKRLLEHPALPGTDLGSIEALFHTGAVCPPHVKRAWIELVGGEKIYEAFGGSELIGGTAIRGDEWLEHPGSVGRAVGAEVRILDERGRELPAGAIGEIYMRTARPGPGYAYLGRDVAPRRAGELESLGDLGWVDEDGYLYIADRRVDMIITGGENVYPAEVENVLSAHPGVRDVAVVGLRDRAWGKRVHAIVETDDSTLSAEALIAHCRRALSAFKVPKQIELVARLPRDEAGKIRRSALVAEREAAADFD